jgi:hypothetical protein
MLGSPARSVPTRPPSTRAALASLSPDVVALLDVLARIERRRQAMRLTSAVTFAATGKEGR